MISIKQLTKSFTLGSEKIQILHDISLNVERGEFVAIMGTSGSGKSTLMNIIGCLDKATEGQYLLNDVDVKSLNEKEIAKVRNQRIGFVFQQFQLLPRLSIIQNVELPLIYAGNSKKERKQLAKAMLESVGLADKFTHMPNQLSGGQKQRVAIARALITNPDFILADEPTGS